MELALGSDAERLLPLAIQAHGAWRTAQMVPGWQVVMALEVMAGGGSMVALWRLRRVDDQQP